MFILKEAIQKICCCLYMALGNKYIDQLFWKAVESESGCLQDAVCCLRKYQADLLNLLSKRIDERELFHLSATLKSFIFFRRNKNNTGLSQPTEKFAVQRSNSDISYDSCSHSYPSGKPAKESQERYPVISIVTPSYNQGKFLEKCIQSILSQDYPNLELIIIDGGSTDESVEIIKKYENQLTFWVSEKDEGQADAINKGLRHVTGEIFNWINSDDYLEPGALFKCAEAYKENPSAAGWIGGCRRIDGKGNVLNVIYPNGFDRENIGQNWYGTQFYQPSCFLSTKIVKEISGLDKNLYIALDLDLWIRVLEKGNVFFAGKGIWSNAVIHAQAKTQEREKVLLETSEVQRKYGFIEGSDIRRKVAFREGSFQYVPPIRLKDGSECQGKFSDIEGVIESPATVTIISDVLPCSAGCPSHNRLLTVIKTLLSNKCRINYFYSSKVEYKKKYIKSLKGDITFSHISSNKRNYEIIVNDNKSDYFWITGSKKDINHLKFVIGIAQRLKARRDEFGIIIDASYLFNEIFSCNHVSDPIQPKSVDEKEYLENTRMLFELAGKIVAVSQQHKKDIEEKFGKINDIEVIPNCYAISNMELPFHKRKHICFIGSYDIDCDIEAVRNFVDNIFIQILRKNPTIEFHVIGDNLKCFKEEFPVQTNVKMINCRGNQESLLANYRLCVFPDTQQTWLNDGFGIAAGAGIPIVTSSAAVEGYPVNDGEECFIADLPREFGEKCNQCLKELITWHNFRTRSQLMIAENYSPKIVAEKLAGVL